MALVAGTNVGFVTTAPVSDPGGTATDVDAYALAVKDTSPAGSVRVTEIGVWVDNATEAADIDLGIYEHDSGTGKPGALVGMTTISKGTTSGWKTASVDIAIDPSTIYWIAFQIDNTATATNTDYTSGVLYRVYKASSGLTDPFGTASTVGFYAYCVYAVVEVAAAGTNTQINIGDTWKDVSDVQINIGDAWKTVTKIEVNIGDSWKTIYAA